MPLGKNAFAFSPSLVVGKKRDAKPVPGQEKARNTFTFSNTPKPVQWGVLLIASALLIFLGEMLGLPAALLLGAMLGAIFLASRESTIKVHKNFSLLAQAIVGLLIARAMTAEFFSNMGQHLPIILFSTGFTLLASTTIGYLLARFRVLPGTTAVWGVSPGLRQQSCSWLNPLGLTHALSPSCNICA